jgi:hypothetical protein
MRTTVQIDNDLMRDLKEQAHREGMSLAKLINRMLRLAMGASRHEQGRSRAYREKTFDMGPPKVSLDKALALAASLEEEEIHEKLLRRK